MTGSSFGDGHRASTQFSFTATAPSPGQRPTATPATNSLSLDPCQCVRAVSHLWWALAGGVVVLLLLVVVFIRTRKPR